ncbi:squamous cell carcinoma antigen recognized by T-cells 3-like isoform X1 [Lytechinus pictus]|uniref:squamous cell carcinoma antigen recognized by T-cells 3-like isoform X1 n=1 Tax=Lytechinus pictus TaxID=7653 RepID=UPI0030BA1A81
MAEFANVTELQNVEMGEEKELGATSEDSSDDSDDEDADDQEIIQLLDEVNSNPYQYDAHLKLITILRQAGELEKLRKARQNMSELFPLTGELWMQWIQDELKLMESGDDRQKVMELFDRAVKDYLAIDLWLEYCQFSIGGIGSPEGIENARRVFEEAIMAAGLHVAQGSMIWAVYREFENALLSTLQPQPGSIPTAEQQKELTQQMNRMSGIFKRQLAIPLMDMEQTFCEYDQWMSDIGEEIPNTVKESYQKALDLLDTYRPLEDSLLTAEAPKLTEYLTYIEHELKQGNPARIQCIYERALVDNCLNMSLWKEYTSYLGESLKISSVVLPVYERAVRNCPWCFLLWQGYLTAQERHNEPFTSIQAVFEKALVAGFSGASDYLQLWQTYVNYLRRRIQWDQEYEEDMEIFRKTMERAIIYQAKYFDAEGDPSSSLQRYLAFVEAKYCQNVTRMRELWNDIMSMGHANQAQMWLQYVNLERRFGDTKHVRKTFHRAIHSVSDWPETVFEAFLNFEREEGTLETWCSAVKRVETQMKRVTEQRNRAAEQEASWTRQAEERATENRSRQRNEKKGGKRSFDEPGTNKQSHKKQKRNPVPDSNPRPESRVDGGTGPSTSSPSAPVFKVPQLPAPRLEPNDEGAKSVSDRVKDIDMEDIPEEKGLLDQSVEFQMHMNPKKKKPERDGNNDRRTIFVKNLDYNLTEERIRNVFSECGAIKDVRMVTNYQKKFKGFCYVEFKDQESAKKALKKDRETINNRPMYVDPSKDKSVATKEQKFLYENKMEKNKLFVTGLPRKLTKEELEKTFSKYGKLKDARIVTYKSGVPKGLAYVDFEDEACASKAVIGLDNTQIGEHTITVAISNPPTRKAPIKDAAAAPPPSNPPERQQKSLGSKGIVGPRGKGRTQVTLLPRSLKQQKAAPKPKPSSSSDAMETNDTTSNGKAEGEGQKKPKMSNADFAKMFQK